MREHQNQQHMSDLDAVMQSRCYDPADTINLRQLARTVPGVRNKSEPASAACATAPALHPVQVQVPGRQPRRPFGRALASAILSVKGVRVWIQAGGWALNGWLGVEWVAGGGWDSDLDMLAAIDLWMVVGCNI